jgi:isoleucyl-tRNA synthetase
VTLEGRAPYERVLAYERVRDETGREMHKSTGNAIEANEAIERMGADVMRWMYSEQVPSQNLNFGYGPAHEIRRRLLTLWNSVKFFVDYANVSPGAEVGELEPLDRWLLSRVEQLVAEATDAYERFWTPDVVASFEAFVDDLSNWYIRRSRRRFWDGDSAALETLRTALLRSLVVIAPVMPFLSEHLWRVLRQDEQPESIFLTSWPEAGERDEQLLAEVGETRRVVDLGRQARAGSQLPLRQPLRRIVVQGAPLAERHVDEIREELRVKEVEFGDVEATELRVKPNLPVLGPKLGKELGAVRAALEAGEFEEANGGFRVAGHDLSAGEVLVERVGREGWAVAHADGITVALDTALDPELEVEKRVLDLIHELNAKRKEAGLELTDRIVVTLPHAASDLLEHEDWIKNEVLAVEIRTDGGSTEPQIAKA